MDGRGIADRKVTQLLGFVHDHLSDLTGVRQTVWRRGGEAGGNLGRGILEAQIGALQEGGPISGGIAGEARDPIGDVPGL